MWKRCDVMTKEARKKNQAEQKMHGFNCKARKKPFSKCSEIL
jgi:hypothetical protein